MIFGVSLGCLNAMFAREQEEALLPFARAQRKWRRLLCECQSPRRILFDCRPWDSVRTFGDPSAATRAVVPVFSWPVLTASRCLDWPVLGGYS